MVFLSPSGVCRGDESALYWRSQRNFLRDVCHGGLADVHVPRRRLPRRDVSGTASEMTLCHSSILHLEWYRDVGLPLSHQGDGESPGEPPPGSENNAGFPVHQTREPPATRPGALCGRAFL